MHPYNIEGIKMDMRAGGVSYRSLAETVGKSAGTVAEWMSGKRYMPLGARVHLWLRISISAAGIKANIRDYFDDHELNAFAVIIQAVEHGTARHADWYKPTRQAYMELASTSV